MIQNSAILVVFFQVVLPALALADSGAECRRNHVARCFPQDEELALISKGISATKPGGVDASPEERIAFRSLMNKIATHSAGSPLKCTETSPNSPSKPLTYSLSTVDEPVYEEAFFVKFASPDTQRKWSTLIAYKGKNEYRMGGLEIKKDGDNVTYEHTFKGTLLEDHLSVSLVNGKLTELSYSKLNPQKLTVFLVKCSLAGI